MLYFLYFDVSIGMKDNFKDIEILNWDLKVDKNFHLLLGLSDSLIVLSVGFTKDLTDATPNCQICIKKRETLNLLSCADGNTDTKTDRNKEKEK